MAEAAIGQIYDGKVTGITKFGAFVSLPTGQTGMVHISEVAHAYVSDINEYLKQGQEVKVKVIGIDDRGRINLSIKKAAPPPEPPPRQPRPARPAVPRRPAPVPPEEMSFEDKLKLFMQTSESKMSDINRNTDRRGGRGRRR